MPSKADEYRRIAAHCLSLAEAAIDPTARAYFIDLAQAWFALANQSHWNSKADLVYETPPPGFERAPRVQHQQQIQCDKESDER